jgi:alkyl sulfatase BDS1-like metallo-beta-lactamase superfamily hydrolase
MTDTPDAERIIPRGRNFFYRGDPEIVAEDVVFFPAFGTVTAFLCEDSILLVDTCLAQFAPPVLEALRSNHSKAPVKAIVYTHGHNDHTSGATAFITDAQSRGHARPRVIAHRDLPARFDRYRLLARQNDFINRVQFGLPETAAPYSNATWTYPDEVYSESLATTIGGERFELYHSRGETDDETYVWCPGRRVLCTGDTFVWSTPNAGNPFKVQRYAVDWARALEHMASLRPAVLLPGHGPHLSGEARVQEALTSTADWLRSIHDQVVAGMNEGKWLEDILREIEYPPTDKPWLQPIYDHPEFVARNVYRLYGGWYDGDAADILPAHSNDVAGALVSAAGAERILDRARKLRDDGDLQLACHLVDFVRKGEPDNAEAWTLWRDLFAARAKAESSLMARGAFRSAVREAEARLKQLGA